MSEPLVFNPRSAAYKEPFGAVSCGAEVSFTCRPLLSEGFTHCALLYRAEFAKREQRLELTFQREEEGRAVFSAALTVPWEPDLLWYHFQLSRDNGTGCFLDKTGYHSRTTQEPWQLTVYRPNRTPGWFGQGMVYQIFPDRFCRLRVPSPEGMVGNRWVHENWSDLPQWWPEEDGVVRNRDFFGGSLQGIASQLDALRELGVSTLYLCPIFESASNHRYNTADYTKIDPMLGTEEDFTHLCREAEKRDIRVVLDGVFNHIGSQSRYFNCDGYYSDLGAAQSKESPYYEWFSFHSWPSAYDSWWGIDTLPAVREECPSYVDFIMNPKDGIIQRWLRAGASGWRLDVADELPDWFIQQARSAVEAESPEALLLGEVWEDASNKISYSRRRKYLLGQELHGVMNYPFRVALLSFLRGGCAQDFYEAMETIRENYPPDAFYSAMNFLGTHDTPRILTMLGASRTPESREGRANYRLSPEERSTGLALVRLASLVLFSFPGAPTVYYGDEVGMEGFEDPFNRCGYPWGSENLALRDWFALLGKFRRERTSLRQGSFRWLYAQGPLLSFLRREDGEQTAPVVNASPEEQTLTLPWEGETARDLITERMFAVNDGLLTLKLARYEGLLLT